MQQGVGDVTLGINHQSGDTLEGGLFEDVDAQAGFTGTGHPDDNGMGGQVVWKF